MTDALPAEETISSYRIHPVASLFPWMPPDEFEDFKESIGLYGQQVPIIVQGDILLDGRNRLKACLELGIPPKVTEYSGSLSPGSYIYELNFQRRHLTEDQAVEIALRASRLIQQEAATRQKAQGARGTEGGRGHKKTLGSECSQGFLIEIPELPPKRVDHPTRKHIAKLAKVSERKAQQILDVQANAPELLPEIRSGALPLLKAAKVVAAKKKPKPAKWKAASKLKQIERYLQRHIDQCPVSSRSEFITQLKEVVKHICQNA